MAENQEVITDSAANNFAQRPPVSSTFGIEHVTDWDLDAIVMRNGQPLQRNNEGSSVGGWESEVT